MNVLVHICCGPCAMHPFAELVRQGHKPVGFWYNPNIQPLKEYKARLESLRKFERESGFDIEYDDTYDLEGHLRAILSDLPRRCIQCYRMRLSRTAEYAREHGFEAFTTTLLVSPYQDREAIIEIGGELEVETGVKFLGIDFSDGFYDGKQRAYDLDLYMQKYCGCVFSEKERYEKRKRGK